MSLWRPSYSSQHIFEQRLLKRRNKDDYKISLKVFNILSHRGNSKLPWYFTANIKKTTDNKGQQDSEKEEPWLTVAIGYGLARCIQLCNCATTILGLANSCLVSVILLHRQGLRPRNVKSPWFERSWTLEENLWIPLYQIDRVVSCPLNVYPYSHR